MNSLVSKVIDFGKRVVRQEDKPLAEPELLRSKPLPMVGLFALLTEDQKRDAQRFTEPDSFGPCESKYPS